MGPDLILTAGDKDQHVFELIYVSSLGHAEIVGSAVPFAEVPVSDPGPRARYEQLLRGKSDDATWAQRVTAHVLVLDAWITEHPDGFWSTL